MRFIKWILVFVLWAFALLVLLCAFFLNPRQESTDLVHAVSRKSFRVEEIRAFIRTDSRAMDATNTFGQRPLQIAALLRRTSAMAALISAGAKLDAVDTNGRTALHSACHIGHSPSVLLLIDSGANITPADKEGRTPLHDLVDWNSDETRLLRRLVRGGADPAARTDDGESPLDIVARRAKQYSQPRDGIREKFRQRLLDHYRAAGRILRDYESASASTNRVVGNE